MELISKLTYQVRKKGLDVDKSDGVKITNTITKRYIHILPTGKVCSNDLLGHDKGLKDLMKEFLIIDPTLYSGSFICIPCNVFLHVGRETLQQDISFAKDCLMQSFKNIKNFTIIKDGNLLPSECKIEYKYALSFNERQAFIKACLEYLK